MTNLTVQTDGVGLDRAKDRGFHVLDLLASPTWHLGPDGRCDWVNQAWLEFTGRTMEQEEGLGWTQSLHPDDRESCLAIYLENFHARQPFQLEYRLRRRDGNYRWMASSGRPEFDAGRFMGCFGFCHDIHDRKMAETRLVHERQIFSAILESVDSLIIACDHEGKLLVYNRMARETHGWTAMDVPVERWAEVYKLLDPFSGKPLPLERVPLYRALRGEKVADQAIDIMDVDGRRRSMVSSGCPLYGALGELLGAVVLVKDVTCQREAEKLRRRDHAMKRTIADILALSLAALPLQTKGQKALKAILKSDCCLAVHEDDYVGLHLVIEGGIDARAATAVRSPKQALSRCTYPITIEGREVGSLEIASEALLDSSQGDCLERTIIPLLASMVQRSWREEKITQLSRVVEQSNTGVLITDATGTILYANQALCRIRGYSLNEVAGARPSLFKSGNTPDAIYRDLWTTILAGREWSGELQNRRKDGSLLWERVSIYPIRDLENRLVNFVANCEDLTLVKQMQQERDALANRLTQAEKMEAIGHLANGIAHDFNNILVAVLGFTELAQKEFGARDPKLGSYLEHSLRAGTRAKDLVAQLLTFSRNGSLEASPLAPGPIVEEVVRLLRSTIPSSLSIQLTIPDGLPWVRVNTVQLHQIMMNLCINARDATAGQGRMDIVLGEVRGIPGIYCASCHKVFCGDYVSISVRDDGAGIPARERHRIFDPFYTTKGVGKGTGLGLSVVHGIVHFHDGHVALSDPDDGGSEFIIYLPIASAVKENRQLSPPRPPVSRLRGEVMVIDDEEGVAEFAREVLEGMGCRVTKHTDSRAAWDLFLKAPQAIDLVVVDQTMPNMTGRELCIKMLSLRPDLPIILWTGFSTDIDEDSARALGIRRFMLKPISAAAISTAAAELLPKERRHDPFPLPRACG